MQWIRGLQPIFIYGFRRRREPPMSQQALHDEDQKPAMGDTPTVKAI